jgi:hypothetical protein
MEALDTAVKLALVLALWAILSAPFLFGTSRAIRWLRANGKQSTATAVSLSAATTLLISPIPTPIITFLVPSFLAWVTGEIYPRMASGHSSSNQLLQIAFASHGATFLVTFLICNHRLRKPLA